MSHEPSLHLPVFAQDDHSYDERDVGNIRVLVADDHRVESHVVEVDRQGEGERAVVADPVRRMDPTGNLEGEVLVEHHRNSSTRSTSMPRVNARPQSSDAAWMTSAKART